jgi:hypothetical protein
VKSCGFFHINDVVKKLEEENKQQLIHFFQRNRSQYIVSAVTLPLETSGANPTIVSYNASAVKITAPRIV